MVTTFRYIKKQDALCCIRNNRQHKLLFLSDLPLNRNIKRSFCNPSRLWLMVDFILKVIPEVLSVLNTLLSFSHMEVETPKKSDVVT